MSPFVFLIHYNNYSLDLLPTDGAESTYMDAGMDAGMDTGLVYLVCQIACDAAGR